MRERKVTIYEGELLGPVDWSYDFASHDRDHGGGMKPEYVRECVEYLRQLGDGKGWQATTYGGWPRCCWGDVIHVGMYDGWPYWRPVPSVLLTTPLGPHEWASFCSITDIRRKEATT